MKHRPAFKQCKIHEPARLIAGSGLQQTWQQRRAHMAHFAGDRVFQHGRVRSAAKEFSRGFVDKAIGDAFVVSQRRGRAARDLFALLDWCQDLFRNACFHPWQRLAFEFGQGRHAGHLFDQIRLTQNIRTPAWHMGHIALKHKAQRFKRSALLFGRNGHADQRLYTICIQAICT